MGCNYVWVFKVKRGFLRAIKVGSETEWLDIGCESLAGMKEVVRECAKWYMSEQHSDVKNWSLKWVGDGRSGKLKAVIKDMSYDKRPYYYESFELKRIKILKR